MNNDKPLLNKNIVITGKLQCPRKEAIVALERLGANVSNTISYATNLVLVGEKVGATKMRKVHQFGIKTITEDDLDRMISG